MISKANNGETIYAKPNSNELPGRETFNWQVIRCFTSGSKLTIDYCQFNYIDNPFKIDRFEKDIMLAKILATSKDKS